MDIDPDVTINSTWKQMEQMVKAGKALSIGVSNFTAAQVEDVIANGEIKPAMNQVESHPYWNQLELQKAMDKHDIKITAYSAFSKNSGAVKNLFEEPIVIAIAEKHGKSVPQVLLRFHIELGRCVIPKSITEERIKQNFESNNFKLDEEDMEKLKNITPQVRSLNPVGFNGVEGELYFKD